MYCKIFQTEDFPCILQSCISGGHRQICSAQAEDLTTRTSKRSLSKHQRTAAGRWIYFSVSPPFVLVPLCCNIRGAMRDADRFISFGNASFSFQIRTCLFNLLAEVVENILDLAPIYTSRNCIKANHLHFFLLLTLLLLNLDKSLILGFSV